MSVAASGKSTFATTQGRYHGYDVVDFASRLPKRNPFAALLFYLLRPVPALQHRVRRNPRLNNARPVWYFDAVARFIADSDRPSVVMGRRLPPEVLHNDVFSRIAIGVVLISEDQHRRNCELRRKQLRNPLPFFHHWTTNFGKVRKLRDEMRAYAEKHHIPVFESFPDAIDSLAAGNAPPRRDVSAGH
jgi:hypothetical protein